MNARRSRLPSLEKEGWQPLRLTGWFDFQSETPKSKIGVALPSLKATNIKAQGKRAAGERHLGIDAKYDSDLEGVEPGIREEAKYAKSALAGALATHAKTSNLIQVRGFPFSIQPGRYRSRS